MLKNILFNTLKFDLLTFCLILLSYLIGSVSNSIVLSNLCKLPDPRTIGSNNPGATNMLRIGGKKIAAIVLILDLLKGFIPVYLAKLFYIQNLVIAAIACAVFLGHLFPIFFKFQGGKGVATTLGIILAINCPLAILVLFTWILIFTLSRISSLAALGASCMNIILCSLYLWRINPLFNISKELNNCLIILSVLIIIKHKENIKKLLNNTENIFQ